MCARTLAVLVAMGIVQPGGSSGASAPGLPRELAGYRSWKLMGGVGGRGEPVSDSLWARCGMLTPAEQERLDRLQRDRREAQGPHTHYVRVFANPIAEKTLRAGGVSFEPGAALVKEKLDAPTGGRARAVAYMIKRRGAGSPDGGGWEFGYRPDTPEADYSGCVTCHRAGAPRDFVYARLSP